MTWVAASSRQPETARRAGLKRVEKVPQQPSSVPDLAQPPLSGAGSYPANRSERGNDLRPPVGAADAIVFAATRA
jgi:hypothetical protein